MSSSVTVSLAALSYLHRLTFTGAGGCLSSSAGGVRHRRGPSLSFKFVRSPVLAPSPFVVSQFCEIDLQGFLPSCS